MDFHFSASINNSEIKYHGIVSISNVNHTKIVTYKDKIIAICKQAFVKKCKQWEVDSRKVTFFEVYYLKQSKTKKKELTEINIFTWEKLENPNLKSC